MKQPELKNTDYENNKRVSRLLNYAGHALCSIDQMKCLEIELKNFDDKYLADVWFSKCPYDQDVLVIRKRQRVNLRKKYNALKDNFEASPILREVNRKPAKGKKKDVLLGWLFYELTKIYTKEHPKNKTECPDWSKIFSVVKDNQQVSKAIDALSHTKTKGPLDSKVFYKGQSQGQEQARIQSRISEWTKFCDTNNISPNIYKFDVPENNTIHLYTQK